MDRLLTYAEATELSPEQLATLKAEANNDLNVERLLAELRSALSFSAERVQRLGEEDLSQERQVGRNRLPTTLGGLLVHAADHTQRHTGQAIVTAKVILAMRG